MAQSLEDLLIQIDASTEKLRRELKKGDTSVGGFARGVNDSLSKIDARFERFGRRAGQAIIAAFGVASARTVYNFAENIARVTDNMALMEARITKLTGNPRAFDEMSKSADRLGVRVETAAQSFTGLLSRANQWGATSDIMKLNEAIMQLGRLGGSSMQEIKRPCSLRKRWRRITSGAMN